MSSASQTSSGGNTTTRQIRGALVHFGDGAGVSRVEASTPSSLIGDLDEPPAWAASGFRTTNTREVRATWSVDLEDIPSHVESLLAFIGESKRVGTENQPLPQGPLRTLDILFAEDGDAELAAKHHNRRHDFLNGTHLSVKVSSQIAFWIPVLAYKAIEKQLTALFASWHQDPTSAISALRVEIWTAGDHFVCVTLSGEFKRTLIGAADLLKAVAEGKTFRNVHGPLWLPKSAKNHPAHDRIRQVAEHHGCYVLLDGSKKEMKYFGPQNGYHIVRQVIVDAIESADQDEDAIHHDPHAQLGDDAPQCSNCGIEPHQATSLNCGHVYCLDCFTDTCVQLPRMDSYIGYIECQNVDLDTCLQVTTLEELQRVLPQDTFEEVLEDSFAAHLRRNVEHYGHCSSPDCTHIYAKIEPGAFGANDKAPAVTCGSCLEVTCLRCYNQHAGATCAEFDYEKSSEREILNAYKREAGIRDCGNCSTSIEKTYGCNHMTCYGCGSHICWICVETFTTAIECVNHLEMMHRDLEELEAEMARRARLLVDFEGGDELEEGGEEDGRDWRVVAGWGPEHWEHHARIGQW